VYPTLKPQTSPLPPELPASPLSLSALWVNGACPGPVGVLRKTRSLTHTDPSAPLVSPRCPATRCFAGVRINIIPWDLRFLCFHTLTHSFATHKTLSHLLSGISALFGKNTRGGGRPPALSRTIRYPLLTTHYSLLTMLSQNFYPPASDLRHNPAAQGRHLQPIPRAGRIQ
jgi:hypothetical protein